MFGLDPTVLGPTGDTLVVRHILAYQPFMTAGKFRAMVSSPMVSSHELGLKDISIQICEKNDQGQWVATEPSPSVTDESCHPDLDRIDREYLMMARMALATIRENTSLPASLSITLETEQDSDYRYEPTASCFFAFIEGGDPRNFTGSVCDGFLNLIPGVRALEQNAHQFWDTLGAMSYDDGGVMGEHELLIAEDSFFTCYQDINEHELTLSSHLTNNGWIHETSLRAKHQDMNILDELRNAALSDLERFHTALAAMQLREGTFAKAITQPVSLIGIEEEDQATVFKIAPGTLRKPGTASQTQ